MTKWKHNPKSMEWVRDFGPLVGVVPVYHLFPKGNRSKIVRFMGKDVSWFVYEKNQKGTNVPIASGVTRSERTAKLRCHKEIKKLIADMCLDANFFMVGKPHPLNKILV